jgi:hypothetical protein
LRKLVLPQGSVNSILVCERVVIRRKLCRRDDRCPLKGSEGEVSLVTGYQVLCLGCLGAFEEAVIRLMGSSGKKRCGREQRGKAAGLRTHMLVALGAALVLMPQQAGISDAALTRVLQGLVAGVGFLGAGTIIKRGEAEEV